MAQATKRGAKVLIIGHNGAGKSSLINKFLGGKKATVGNSVIPTDHKLIEEISFREGGNEITIYDTKGLGDPETRDRNIFESAISKMKTADIVLICQKLYDRIDDKTEKMIKESVRIMGNELMKHAIFVFTFGDEYFIRCDDTSNDAFKAHMEAQENEIVNHLRKILKKKGIKEEIANNIPSIITCGKKIQLPTSENWVVELWNLVQTRCTPEGAKFVGWWRRHVKELITGSVVGATMTGAIAGAATGAIVGTSTVPVIGTIVGATIGAIGGGAILGGAIGTGTTVAVVKINEKKIKKN